LIFFSDFQVINAHAIDKKFQYCCHFEGVGVAVDVSGSMKAYMSNCIDVSMYHRICISSLNT